MPRGGPGSVRGVRRITMFDNSFTETAGHNYPYMAAVHAEAVMASVSCDLIAHRSLDHGGLANLEPVTERRFRVYAPRIEASLPGWMPRRVRVILGVVAGNLDTAFTVGRTIRRRRGEVDQTLFLFANTFASNILGLLLAVIWCSRYSCDRRLDVVCVFHNKPSRPLSVVVRVGLAALRRRCRLRVVVHSERNREIDVTGEAALLRLPYVRARRPRPRQRHDEDEPLTVGYLGIATWAKGFDVAIGAIDDLLVSTGERFRFDVQLNPRDERAAFVSATERLLKLEQQWPERIQIMHGPLESGRYAKALDACDIMMIPHRASVYGSDESGVFLECVAAGTPLVASADSAMGRRVASGEALGVTFLDGDSRSLADAIEKLSVMIDHAGGQGEDEAQVSAATEMWRFLLRTSTLNG